MDSPSGWIWDSQILICTKLLPVSTSAKRNTQQIQKRTHSQTWLLGNLICSIANVFQTWKPQFWILPGNLPKLDARFRYSKPSVEGTTFLQLAFDSNYSVFATCWNKHLLILSGSYTAFCSNNFSFAQSLQRFDIQVFHSHRALQGIGIFQPYRIRLPPCFHCCLNLGFAWFCSSYFLLLSSFPALRWSRLFFCVQLHVVVSCPAFLFCCLFASCFLSPLLTCLPVCRRKIRTLSHCMNTSWHRCGIYL